MKGNHENGEERRILLRRLARRGEEGKDLKVDQLSSRDLQILVHELGVYQEELETQNEELRQARENLEEARDRYIDLYEFAPVGYLTLDADGFIRELNREARRFLGDKGTGIVGRKLSTFLSGESARELVAYLSEAATGDKKSQVLEVHLSAESGTRHLRLKISPRREGEALSFRIAAVDVTEAKEAEMGLRESENIFRSLAEAAPLGIFETDAIGRFRYVNENWTKITGLYREQSLGYGWKAAIHPEDRKRIVGKWAGRIGADPWVQEFRLRRPDGSERWGRLHAAPSGMRKGKPAGYVGTLEDITAPRRMQEELIQARKNAEEGSRAKSEFLANMSHEIRTPLTVTRSALELLKDSGVRKDQAKLLEMAFSASGTLLGLISDILDFSRIEARKLEVHPEPTFLRPCLERALEQFALEAKRKGLGLTLEVDPQVSDMVVLDQKRIHQVLTNLIGNAVKFTEKGRITLGVAAAGKGLCFFIRDMGIGMPPDQIDRLFESFTQLDSSDTRKYGGTGLGLAISRGLVELMGGRIWAESLEGEGSVFSFTLPGAERVSVPEAEAPAPRTIDGLSPLNARILLVDDNLDLRQIIKMVLENWHCEVLTAGSGEEALRIWEQAGNGGCDLVLMDLQMPGMSGLEATRIIREKERETKRHLPILALTAHTLREIQWACKEVGMDGGITKPIDTKLLHDTIRKQLERFSS